MARRNAEPDCIIQLNHSVVNMRAGFETASTYVSFDSPRILAFFAAGNKIPR